MKSEIIEIYEYLSPLKKYLFIAFTDTENAFMIIESVDPARHNDVLKAMDAIAENAQKYLGASVLTKSLITSGSREVIIEK